MIGLQILIPALFFILAIADLLWFDVSVITPVITFSAFLYVIEDFFKDKRKIKNILNFLGTLALLLAVLVFFKDKIPQDNFFYPYATGFLTFMKNASDFITIFSVVLVIIYKLYTANKTEKLEQLKEELLKEYSASEIQKELKIGKKAYVITDGSFKDYTIERKSDDVIYWTFPPHGVTDRFKPNSDVERVLRFKIIPS